ncbi:DUF2269 domain-containing protein [Corynebacterium sp. sy017]|uniref:DUF2269 domain-containing protein n=1 Tax=unclassified Corynebacterium TaxID=2624378 RepID=UPI001184CDF6|nr:DUF2269 domain-containing protein [Corynebacterium sp. SY003]MBP3088987.1 DUF2269 domain-containing protein [Corynebacterium sp. sy017]TSD91309.1 DUF2269 domain-containing protein [Corynebacterium sp. SY003]
MGSLLVLLHVIAAILFLGPVTFAVSTFHVRAFAAHNGDELARGSAAVLYKITRTYGILSVLVPLIGFAIMFTGDYWSEGKFHISIMLSVFAWGILYFLILPIQQRMADALSISEGAAEFDSASFSWEKAKNHLSMFGGIFSLLWVIIAVLMIL